MKKDRFVAFFDAIMAIIMTIAVLQFAVPAGAKWSDLGDLGFQVLVYAMSFFWLGMLWISIHNMWHKVEYITRGVLVINIIMLFFTSMIPFFIIYIGRYFNEPVPQLLYGIDVICVSVFNHLSLELLGRHNPQVEESVKAMRRTDAIDLSIKLAGIIIGMTLCPAAVAVSVFVAGIMLLINFMLMKKKKQ